MQVNVYYDSLNTPTITFTYVGDTDCIRQSSKNVPKRTPKTFNIFEAKQFIQCLIHDTSTKYYIKPVKET